MLAKQPPLARWTWLRNPANPILKPDPESLYDCRSCMNPFVIRVEDQYRVYYSGGDAGGRQRICLATAPVDRPTEFNRRGVVLDLGRKGDFDGKWCVTPLVRRFGDRWHLYYTGNDGGGLGLQSFCGIGLAVSQDGLGFRRLSTDPVITGDRVREFPKNRGVAGGGTITEERGPDGAPAYRLYYTLTVGTKNPDVRLDQEKHCAVAHSRDGLRWTDHRLIMSPRPEVANEDIAVAGPVVWREENLYRMLYCGIGSRWGFYSISEAASFDGYAWHRGRGDENLSLAPGPADSWENQMVEYPAVIEEGNLLRIYYCGNGYGKTGIGTATSVRTGKRG
ncbi:MAG TPA: hypothetical protein PKN80_05240 [bacterium]|uniref:Glycosyl hydrolases family 43 n=1 Tax=candidate division TA06 bacterium ADurb.Bin417 TaxID=1852828 RepID=A0A1V5M9N4_UNCT6|nr:MAG: hypothetical protein BWY73_01413 [candidate division TA06 bacterium ADurb.Bin417]HNQ35454.1 hypothetical protein [bacterium]HNS48315.1 hypothetical protein [bacterium]